MANEKGIPVPGGVET